MPIVAGDTKSQERPWPGKKVIRQVTGQRSPDQEVTDEDTNPAQQTGVVSSVLSLKCVSHNSIVQDVTYNGQTL